MPSRPAQAQALRCRGGSRVLGMLGHGGDRLLGTISDRRGEASGKDLNGTEHLGRGSHTWGKELRNHQVASRGPRREGSGGCFSPINLQLSLTVTNPNAGLLGSQPQRLWDAD